MTPIEPFDLTVKDISFINDIKSMAIIGTSEKRNFFFLRNHQENFKGTLYAIHPTLKEIPEFPKENIYPSVKDVPGELDFAFIAVPARQILNIIDDCVEKGVKLISIFTAEFSDSGTKEGIELEKELIKRAKNDVRILGPNGMGLYYPKLGITWRSKFPTKKGNIGLIAQSGGMCNIVVYTGTEFGINFSKVFSYGNGADLDFIDLLYFLSNDPETDIILCYIEGIKQNRVQILRRVLNSNKKPIVILKGGKSERGEFAARTHTASVAGNTQIWHSLIKQYNLIEVDSLEQLINTARIIDFYGSCDFKNIAVFSISGGHGVVLVDLIESAGMIVPDFSYNIQERLNKTIFINGTSPKNPLDIAAQLRYSDSIKNIIDIALSDEKIDTLIVDFPSWYFSYEFFISPDKDYEKNVIEAFTLGHKHKKPLLPIIQPANTPEEHNRILKILAEQKVPAFKDPLEFIPLLPKISKFKRKLLELKKRNRENNPNSAF